MDESYDWNSLKNPFNLCPGFVKTEESLEDLIEVKRFGRENGFRDYDAKCGMHTQPRYVISLLFQRLEKHLLCHRARHETRQIYFWLRLLGNRICGHDR